MIRDTNNNKVAIIDSFKSLIWTDRYGEAGDFELYVPARIDYIDILRKDYYVELIGGMTDRTMIIEDLEIETDLEDGNYFIVKGRSLESLLDRRIIWNQLVLESGMLTAINRLLKTQIIEPMIPERAFPNFKFVATDFRINRLPVHAQYTGDVLYDVIVDILKKDDIGFKITKNEDGGFVFKLYKGTDRSYAQSDNSFVVFSPEFENIMNSSFKEKNSLSKNVTLVAGEGEGSERVTTVVGNASGLERRELYTDARDLSTNVEEGQPPITQSAYISQLQSRGVEKLKEHQSEKIFEAKADVTRTFRYGTDFFLGDIIEMRNEYGLGGPARVDEIIFSQDENGIDIYPTFVVL